MSATLDTAVAAPGLRVATLHDWIGRELGCSEWVAIDQARIGQFADCTGDHQWIHVDVERARRESPLGAPVAHGYLTLALLAPLAMRLGVVPEDALAVLNYGLDRVRFIAPVRAGSRVRARVRFDHVQAQEGGRHLIRLNNTLEIEGHDKPALIADTLLMVVGPA